MCVHDCHQAVESTKNGLTSNIQKHSRWKCDPDLVENVQLNSLSIGLFVSFEHHIAKLNHIIAKRSLLYIL
jgi:hypothetical protein